MRKLTTWLGFVAALAAGCGDNGVVADARVRDDGPELPVDGPPVDAAHMVRIYGNLNFNGPVFAATVMTLGDGPQQTTSSGVDGDFYFDVVEGSRLIVEAIPPPSTNLFPMIRGVVAEDQLRPRVFYLLGPPDVSAASALGKSFDPATAIVETDFRNAAIGGYGATLGDGSGNAVPPDYGIVYDDNGDPVLGDHTVAGGDGSTLLLAGLPAGDVSFAPDVPPDATLPCHADDAQPLPLVAGAVTWFDFECGNGTD